jgi:hypothetical protein
MWRTRAASLIASFVVAGAGTITAQPPVAAASPSPSPHFNCSSGRVLCTEVQDPEQVFGEGNYVGHDEPSLLFYSNVAGSGNSSVYRMTLPKDPPTLPKQNGRGGTFNFQLHPAFWFGMAMCDDQSSPNPGAANNVPCTPDSNANVYDSPDPTSSHYIGLHPGIAFMEMQFYAPGWVSWPPGDSCDATRWCAALNIDSLTQNSNTGIGNNAACLNMVGPEPVNFAFITKSGVAHAPANPVDATLATYTPNAATDLFMNSGDHLMVDLHDTRSGFRVVIHDLTTGQTGSMTSSVANDFGQVKYAPNATTCSVVHHAFHPAYSTSSEHTRVPWAAHSYNVAFSDEIGHWEYCEGVNSKTGNCNDAGVNDRSGLDGDDVGCFRPRDSTRIRVGGCFGTDVDFDGVPYQNVWPGTFKNHAQDALLHPTPVQFTSPLFNGSHNYARVAFEADLPRIEDSTNPPCQRHLSNPADPSPGAGCVNPPVGSNFYPFFSTNTQGEQCVWQLGGAYIPGTTNWFGGSSAAEFGGILASFYPAANGQPQYIYENFHNTLATNPCRA